MPQSHASFTTEHGSRYLQQLCKHWSHKLPVEFTPEKGEINLGEGRICRLEAAPKKLTMIAQAPDQDVLTNLEGVIIRHIARFAFREEMGDVSWTPVSQAAE